MKELWTKFCTETTIHGLIDLNNSKTWLLRFIWVMILGSALAATTYQIYVTINNFYSNPTKTEITTLKQGTPVRYPPILIQTLHFTDWLNLTKAKLYEFDVDTLLYAMSFYQVMATTKNVNVTDAFNKLTRILKRQNISNLYQLAMELSTPVPLNVISPNIWLRFLSPQGTMNYVSYVYGQYTTEAVYFKCFANFNFSQFNTDSLSLFDYSFVEEYKMLRTDKPNSKRFLSFLPFIFNAVGEPETQSIINFNVASHEFILKPSLYSWLPTKDAPCVQDIEADFFTECSLKCSLKYEYIIALNSSIKEHEKCRLYVKNVEFSRVYCPFDNMLYSVNLQNVTNEQYERCVQDCTTNGCLQWKHDFNQIVSPQQTNQDDPQFLGSIMLTNGKVNGILVITQSPSVTWTEAIGNVGGLIGLWLGGSILSLIQILNVFCWYPLERRWETYRLKTTLKKDGNSNVVFTKKQSFHSKRQRKLSF